MAMALHRPRQDNSFEKGWFRYGHLAALQPSLGADLPLFRFRIRVERDGDRVRLITRGGYNRR
jgi:hypothetical protein